MSRSSVKKTAVRAATALGLLAITLLSPAGLGLQAAPPAGRINTPTPSVTKEQFLGFSSVNMSFNYFEYGWSVGDAPPGWGFAPDGFSSADGGQKLRSWLNMCADNNMFGTRIMSVFGDGRNLFDAQGNVKINETLFRADLDAFFQIVDEVETARHVKFRIIFTLFDFRIADGELIGGLGEHPEIFDPSDPRRRQIIHLFRKNLFEAVYDPVNRHAGQGLLRENRVVWELLNEFTSLKPNTNGRSEADAMDDPAYRRQRETLHDQAESFFMEFKRMIKSVNPRAPVAMSDLGAENTIRRWQDKGFDLLDYHSHPDYLSFNGNVGVSLKNVGWNGRQPLIEGEAYIPGWQTADKSTMVERMRASFNRGSRGCQFWWDDWYRFSPDAYKTITPGDLIFAAAPDLVVERIGGGDSLVAGQTASFRVTVGNWGDLPAGESVLKLLMDGNELTHLTVPALAPGENIMSDPIPWTAVGGRHSFQAQADNWLRVAEYDEDNNNVAKTIRVKQEFPDLVTESVTGADNLTLGQTAAFIVVVANRGKAPAGTSVLKTQIDGSQIDSRTLPVLQPGDVVVSTIPWIVTAGTHTLLVQADNWQQVAESNEQNNDVSKTFFVSAPDLVMESVTGTSNLVAGQTAVFTVTVANRGTAPAGTSVLKTQIDGSQIDSRALPALQPGDVVVSTIPWTASAGGHTLLVEADNWQQVPESDETNNNVSTPFDVAPTPYTFSTYFGGSGNSTINAMTVDKNGDIYVAGQTTDPNLPTTSGAYDTSYNGGTTVPTPVPPPPGGVPPPPGLFDAPATEGPMDAFVAKFAPDGRLLYSTYLGGSGEDAVQAIAVNAAGEVYLTGKTYSTDFPVTPGAYDKTLKGGRDAFAAKLSADGSQLLSSTYLGGDNWDYGNAIALDRQGNVYVGGFTHGGFPVTAGAAQTVFGGLGDGFIAKLSPDAGALLYATYAGGESWDGVSGMAVDKDGYVYAAGTTHSKTFPTTAGAWDTVCDNCSTNVSTDGFLLKLSTDGAHFAYSTFVGGAAAPASEGFTALTVDAGGVVTAVGDSNGPDFPVTARAVQPANSGNMDAVVVRMSADGGRLLYGSYLGGSGNDQAFGVLTDEAGDIYVAGATDSPDFPGAGSGKKGGVDAFLAKLDPLGGRVLATALLGGGGTDQATAGPARDSNGTVFLAGGTGSSDFPVTSNAFQKSFNGGDTDGFLAGFSGFSPPKPPETVPLPDLVVENLPGLIMIQSSQWTTFSITVANRGTAPAGPSVLKTQINGSQIDSRTLPALQPGDVIISTMSWFPPGGSSLDYALMVEADNWLQVAESNEQNNIATSTVRASWIMCIHCTDPDYAPGVDLHAEFALGEVYAFPNPARRGAHPVFHVETGLADSVQIRLYDVSGSLVYETQMLGDPVVVDGGEGPRYAYEQAWDISRVPSGVYLGVVETRKKGFPNLHKRFKTAVVK